MRRVRPATRWTFQSLAADCSRCSMPWRADSFLAAGEQHVDAVEIGLDRAGIELERLVEGAAGFEHMHLAAQAVARVLEMRDAEAGPRGGVILVLLNDVFEEAAGAVEVVERAGARHERREHGARLQVLLGESLVERDAAERARLARVRRRCSVLQVADALQRGEDFVADFGLHADEVEGCDVDGSARAHGLRGNVEQLPVQVEAGAGAHEVAGEHEAHQQLLADGERVELLRGDRHQRAGGPDDERGHAGRRAAMASASA